MSPRRTATPRPARPAERARDRRRAPPFQKCVDALLAKGLDGFSPDDLQTHFEQAGFGDFLPRWSDADLQTITADGKIPVFRTWKDKLSAGSVGLEALMNIGGLCSFAIDQKAFDDRVRSLL